MLIFEKSEGKPFNRSGDAAPLFRSYGMVCSLDFRYRDGVRLGGCAGRSKNPPLCLRPGPPLAP